MRACLRACVSYACAMVHWCVAGWGGACPLARALLSSACVVVVVGVVGSCLVGPRASSQPPAFPKQARHTNAHARTCTRARTHTHARARAHARTRARAPLICRALLIECQDFHRRGIAALDAGGGGRGDDDVGSKHRSAGGTGAQILRIVCRRGRFRRRQSGGGSASGSDHDVGSWCVASLSFQSPPAAKGTAAVSVPRQVQRVISLCDKYVLP